MVDRVFPPDLTRLTPGQEILDREGRTLSVLPALGGTWRFATTTRDVPPDLVALLIAAEDGRFRRHPGVDPFALARAAWQWVRTGRVVSGGSTLTMQAARLLEPRPRNLRSKLIEIVRAVQLEARFSKDEILGIWLTLAPQGGNLEGVRAGSLAWFGRPPARLDPAEAALLIALARRPGALRPDRHPEASRAARDAVLAHRTAASTALTSADRTQGQAVALPTHRRAMPRYAPHSAREVARLGGARIPTTLDLPLQRAVETMAAQALETLPERTAIAVAVADHAAREFRVLVGGTFGDEQRAGSLDLTLATRSPGSALKPFLYAMAFEAGLTRPETVLADLPFRFATYAPENFDRGFAGQITAADALRQSLNLPAVALLDRLGPLRFAAALKAAGAAPRLAPGAAPSLPLALGGAGTTLREMMALYATLAGEGVAEPLQLRPGGARVPVRVLEASAARQVAGILTQGFPGGGPAGIAWKTGTSWGGRDAWAFGFDRAHVVGIWIGRPDGTPIPGATGRSLAMPVLARVMGLLPPAPLTGLRVRPASNEAGADRLRLLFPPPEAQLSDAAGPVTLRAMGGQRPLTFLVDGQPIAHERARREASWQPPGLGFFRITVLDAQGQSARAEVRVRAE
ncbi:penicillin-binding protein 1C [Plastoroseomonas arctica]|uniref:penicillin-binding protein 1C n=1 Tax=Plastoroseomonas arctica TaxID=1509237 RepID=UPI003462FCD3